MQIECWIIWDVLKYWGGKCMNLILAFSNLLLTMVEMRRLSWSGNQCYQGMVPADRAREVILEIDFTIILECLRFSAAL